MKAVILAGGRGSRFGEITNKTPKSLICVGGIPLIEHLFNSLPREVDTCIIVIGYLGDMIRRCFGSLYGKLKLLYVEQRLIGTAGALFSAKESLLGDEYFLVVGSDDIFGKNELVKLLLHQSTYGISFSTRQAVSHSGIKLDPDGYLDGFNHEPLKESLGRYNGVGAYYLSQDFFKQRLFQLNNGEYSIPHTLSQATFKVKGVIIDRWLPVNNQKERCDAEEIISSFI